MIAESASFYDVVLKHNLYSNQRNLNNLLISVFGNTSFTEKKVLDIGGGNGLLSFYAAYKGAQKVVCLEPEAAGSHSGYIKKFNEVCDVFGFRDRVVLASITLQNYEPQGEPFDIAILYDSINHLDEIACSTLLKNPESRAIYVRLLQKLKNLLNPGAILIICDCSRYNLFQFLGVKNPIAKTIEWYKHQDPITWIALLREVGFIQPVVHWSSFNTLGSAGRLLLGNRIASYFFDSHFCLTVKNP